MGYKVRGNKIYVYGTVDGIFYRLSTGKDATPLNLKWIKKNHRDVLLKLVAKEKPKRPTLLKEYGILSIENNAYSRKPSTTQGYLNMFNKHILPYFKNYALTDLKPSDIKAWQSKLLKQGLSPKTVKNIRIVLSTILSDAKLDGLIETNPMDYVKAPRQQIRKEIKPFALQEVKTIIKNADGWFRNFLIVAFFTGMRPGELLALKWEDINFKSKKIHIRRAIRQGTIDTPKNGRDRMIDMLPLVEKALREQYLKNGLEYSYIFPTKKGTPYTETGSIIKNRWKPLLKRCLIDYRILYQTRHTFASLMLKNGEDILWVSKMLGHADTSTTSRYYIKFVENKNEKRAQFLDNFMENHCTVIAQSSKMFA